MLHHASKFIWNFITLVGFHLTGVGIADRSGLRMVLLFSRLKPKSGLAVRNLFEAAAVDELISRIDSLQPAAQRQWGKMDVAQMLAHCSAALDLASGRLNPQRTLIGRLIGRFIKPIYWNEKPFSRNNPTAPKLVVSDRRDLLSEQEQLRTKIRKFHERRGKRVHETSASILWRFNAAAVEPWYVQTPGSSFAAV